MGCDGGTIPRRDELVRVKKKPEAKDKDSELVFQWRYCAVTQQLLESPIVTCGLGKLYNKIAIIEALLNKEALPECASHIKSLKDIKELNLTPNPSYMDGNKKEHDTNLDSAPYICPVIGLEMSGKFRFIALWSCGCVFSERALKQIETKVCHKCQKPFEDKDVIVLNGNEDDLIVMREKMEIRQLENKKNKTKKVKTEVKVKKEEVTDDEKGEIPDVKQGETSGVKQGEASGLNGVKQEKKISSVKVNGVLPSKRPGTLHKSNLNVKKMKADYSVAKDPQASDVYKSLFTSHQSEKEQNRAHWVTYNPFYN